MRWEDENYVKLYARDTPTWRAMRWEAKALLPLLLRVLDKAGLLECGDLGRAAIGLMTGLPEEVAAAGLADLERLGTVGWHGNVLEMPKFEEAQEARKSDILRKREERQRAKDKLNAQDHCNSTQVASHDVTRRHTASEMSHGVTRRHEMSHGVTLQTSQTPQTETTAGAKRPEPAAPVAKPASPRLKPLSEALVADYLAVRGCDYRHQGAKDAQALKSLLPVATDEEVRARWRRGLAATGWASCSTLAQLASKWNDLAASDGGPPQESRPCRLL